MTIDASIPLGVNNNQASPLDAAAKAMTLKHLQQQDQLAPLQTQAAQQNLQTGQLQQEQIKREMAKQDGLKKAWVIGDDGKLDVDATYKAMGQVDPAAAQVFMTNKLKSDSEFRDKKIAQHEKLTKDMSQYAAAVQTQMDMLPKDMPDDAKFEKVKPMIEGYLSILKQVHGADSLHGEAMSKITPESIRQSALQNPDYLKAHMEKSAPQSAEGKIVADVKSGRLTDEQGKRALEKKDAIKVNVNSGGTPAKGWKMYNSPDGDTFRVNENAGVVQHKTKDGKWEDADALPANATHIGAKLGVSNTTRDRIVQGAVDNSIRQLKEFGDTYKGDIRVSNFFGTHPEGVVGKTVNYAGRQALLSSDQKKRDADAAGIIDEMIPVFTGGLRSSDSYRQFLMSQFPNQGDDEKSAARKMKLIEDNIKGVSKIFRSQFASNPKMWDKGVKPSDVEANAPTGGKEDAAPNIDSLLDKYAPKK